MKKFVTKHTESYEFYKLDLDNPKTELRDDIRLIPYAIYKGFNVVEGKTFSDANMFTKGIVDIWTTGKDWRACDIVDGRCCNVRVYSSLSDALNTEGE